MSCFWPNSAQGFPELSLVFNVADTVFPLPGFPFSFSLIAIAPGLLTWLLLAKPSLSFPQKHVSSSCFCVPSALCMHIDSRGIHHTVQAECSLSWSSHETELPEGRTASAPHLWLLTWPSAGIRRTRYTCLEWMMNEQTNE